ncbi:MAG: GNAT family N-acetyltransferase [Rhodobacterales bacterium]|nr:GNAT family N-acetyltransferase [Rhodobacterales bacterium]
MTPPIHRTPRLTLGQATMQLFEAFGAFCASDHSQFMGGPGGHNDAWESVATYAGQWVLRGYGTFWLNDSSSGEPSGRVGIWHPLWLDEPELSWVIYEGHTRKGLATEAAATVLDWPWHSLHLPALMSLIDPANVASVAVAQQLGASAEGEHGQDSGKTVTRWRHMPGGIA